MDISKNYEVPKSLLDNWFDGDINIFNQSINQLLEGIDENNIRNKLNDIVKFYNPDYKYWVNSVYNKILNLKMDN
jgi:hypothetical protein